MYRPNTIQEVFINHISIYLNNINYKSVKTFVLTVGVMSEVKRLTELYDIVVLLHLSSSVYLSQHNHRSFGTTPLK